MLHRIRNLQLAMKVPKQLMQKLKAKPQSSKKKTLKKKAVRTIAKAHVKRPEAESGDDEADSCEEETTEETADAAEETLSAADREVSPQEESEVTAE